MNITITDEQAAYIWNAISFVRSHDTGSDRLQTQVRAILAEAVGATGWPDFVDQLEATHITAPRWCAEA